MPASVLLKIGGGFALAALAAVLVPRLDGGSGGSPAATTLLVTAVCVGALTIGALYLALTGDLGLPKTIALYVVGFNALVVLVKFVLSPEALYERSDNGSLEVFFDLNVGFDTAVVAGAVFALYAGALYVVYRVCRRRLESSSLSWRRVLGVGAVTAVLLLATGWMVLLAAWGGLEYVGIVLSSGVSLLVAGALVGAISLASVAFRQSAARAELLGDATLLVSVFWVALAFLALYHVLWVVYILVLTSIWPLKVITPK
jgi:hypothetical protein